MNCPLGSFPQRLWGSQVQGSSPEVLRSAELLLPSAVGGLCVTPCPHVLGEPRVEGPGFGPSPSPQHPLESSSRSGVAPMGPRAMSAHPEPPARGVCDTLAKEGTWAQGRCLASSSGAAQKAENPWGCSPSSSLLLFPFLLISWGFSFCFFFILFFFFFFSLIFPPLLLFFFLFFYLLFKYQTKEEKPAMGALEPGARLLGGRYRVPGWLLGALPGVWGVGVLLALGRNRLPCCVEVLLESGVCSGSPESLSV